MTSVFIRIIETAKPEGLMCRLLINNLKLLLPTCDAGEQALQSVPNVGVQQKTLYFRIFFSLQILMLQNVLFIISLLSWVIKFHLPTDGGNATDQLLREKAAWREKESVPVSSKAFPLGL